MANLIKLVEIVGLLMFGVFYFYVFLNEPLTFGMVTVVLFVIVLYKLAKIDSEGWL